MQKPHAVLEPAHLALVMTSLVLLGVVAATPAMAAEESAATGASAAIAAHGPVIELEDALLGMMQRADELGFDGRLQEIAPVVAQTMDLEFMARTSIGRAWRDLGAETRERWVTSFGAYTTAKLADQFDGYSGQKFERVGDKPASRETLVVMTRLDRPGQDPVRLDFRVREIDGEWKIIDIYAKGNVSEVALRRSEYAGILESSGIEGLIESVDQLTAKTAGKGRS